MMPASNVKYEDADHTPSPHLSLEMQPLGTLATPMAMCHWTAATAASHKCNSKLFIIPPMAQFWLQFSFFLLLKIMFFFLAIWGKTNLETERPILIWHQCMCAKVRNNDIANGVWQFCPDRSGTKYRPHDLLHMRPIISFASGEPVKQPAILHISHLQAFSLDCNMWYRVFCIALYLIAPDCIVKYWLR